LAEIRASLPTAPKSALAPDINMDEVPTKPPFTAHLSSVSYEADEIKIRGFFADSKILNIRLPVDERGRFRGFGQVDFENRESLINALAKNETKFFNRPIKVQLDSGHPKRPGQEGGGSGSRYGAMSREIDPNSNSEDTDWRARSAPESEEAPSSRPSYSSFGGSSQQRQGGGGGGGGGGRYHNNDSQQGGGGGGRREGGYGQNRDRNSGEGGQQQRGAWQNRNDGDRPSHYQPRDQQSGGSGGYQQRSYGLAFVVLIIKKKLFLAGLIRGLYFQIVKLKIIQI
jgi:RNA recognition motif-containing protein